MSFFRKIVTLALIISTLAQNTAYAAPEDTKRELYESYIVDICGDYPIDPFILMALVEKESNFKAEAVSSNGKWKGLTQLNPYFFKDRMEHLGITNSMDPYSNLLLCADFIYYKLEEGNDIELVLMMWNMGEDKAEDLYSKGVVSSYAKKIVSRAKELGGGSYGTEV